MHRRLDVRVGLCAAVTLLIALAPAACSDDTEPPDAGCCDAAIDETGGGPDGPPADGPPVDGVLDPDGGGSDGPAGDATGVDGPAADAKPGDAQAPRCRSYATKYTDNSAKTTTCAFDKTKLLLTCDAAGAKTFYQYPSLLAFIREAEAVGRITYTRVWYSTSSKTVFDYSYDSKDRLTGFQHKNQAKFYRKYTAWDAKGRPTTGTGSTSSSCTGYGVAYTYDDAKRTRYLKYSGTGACPSGYVFYHVKDTFDADGNRIKSENYNLSNKLASTYTYTYTIASTAKVCL